MSLAKQARAVERDLFGALIGTLLGTVICRLVVLVVDIDLYALLAVVFIAAWSGALVVHFGTSGSEAAMASIKSLADWFRAVCLRIVLWLLGAAAVLGVLSVLTSSFDVVGRVAGTALVTGLAAGFLWPFLAMLDESKQWRVGLLGVASVLTAYFLVTPSIWGLGHRVEETALSAMVVVLIMPVGLIAMRLTHAEGTRVSGILCAALYLISLTSFLLAVWDSDWRMQEELYLTAFAVLGFGSFAVAALVGAGTGDGRPWRWLGVIASAAVTAMCLWDIWTRDRFDEDWVVSVASVAVVVAHINLSFLAPLRGGQVLWRIGTIAAVIATAVALDLDLFLKPSSLPGITMLGRLALASGILASAGTLGMLILARLNRNIDPSIQADQISAIALQCPRCGKRQTVSLGIAPCSNCGLKLKVEIVLE